MNSLPIEECLAETIWLYNDIYGFTKLYYDQKSNTTKVLLMLSWISNDQYPSFKISDDAKSQQGFL